MRRRGLILYLLLVAAWFVVSTWLRLGVVLAQQGVLGPQGKQFYYKGGPAVLITDGGTQARNVVQARYNLGAPWKFGWDSIPAPWILSGSIVLPWTLASDTLFRFMDDVDTTKRADFHLEGFTTATTNHFTLQNRSGTVALSGDAIGAGVSVYDPLLRVKDAQFFVKDDADTTKKFQFQASSITTGNTRTYTMPDATGSVPLLSTTNTWSGTSNTFNNAVSIGNGLTNKGIAYFYDPFATASSAVLPRTLNENRIAYLPDASGDIVLCDTLTAQLSPGGVLLPRTHVTDADLFIKDNGDTTKKIQVQASGITTATTRTWTAPDKSGTLAMTSDLTAASITGLRDTLSSLYYTAIQDPLLRVKDSQLFIKDDADTTKKAQFQVSGISTGTTRTYTLPNTTGSVPLLSTANVWTSTNDFRSSTVSTAGASGALRVYEAGGSNYHNLLSGASLTGVTATFPDQNGTVALTSDIHTQDGSVIQDPTIRIKDASLFLKDDSDTTKKVQLQLSGITTATTKTYNAKDYNAGMVLYGDSSITTAGGAGSNGRICKLDLANLSLPGAVIAIDTTTIARAPAPGVYMIDMGGVTRSTLSGTLTVRVMYTDNYTRQNPAFMTLAATAGSTPTVGGTAPRLIHVASGDVTVWATGPSSGSVDLWVRMVPVP